MPNKKLTDVEIKDYPPYLDRPKKPYNPPTNYDYVRVVRCKDCLYYDRGQCNHERHNHYVYQPIYLSETDFCSYGKRR